LRNFKDVRRFGIDDAWESRKITLSIDELLPDEEYKYRDMEAKGWDGTISFDRMTDCEGVTLSKKFKYIHTESFFAENPLFVYEGKTVGY
jgi:hypothetical protein